MDKLNRLKGQFLKGEQPKPKKPSLNGTIHYLDVVHSRISGTGRIPPRKGAE